MSAIEQVSKKTNSRRHSSFGWVELEAEDHELAAKIRELAHRYG
jgi:hypothetical protein